MNPKHYLFLLTIFITCTGIAMETNIPKCSTRYIEPSFSGPSLQQLVARKLIPPIREQLREDTKILQRNNALNAANIERIILDRIHSLELTDYCKDTVLNEYIKLAREWNVFSFNPENPISHYTISPDGQDLAMVIKSTIGHTAFLYEKNEGAGWSATYKACSVKDDNSFKIIVSDQRKTEHYVIDFPHDETDPRLLLCAKALLKNPQIFQQEYLKNGIPKESKQSNIDGVVWTLQLDNPNTLRAQKSYSRLDPLVNHIINTVDKSDERYCNGRKQ